MNKWKSGVPSSEMEKTTRGTDLGRRMFRGMVKNELNLRMLSL